MSRHRESTLLKRYVRCWSAISLFFAPSRTYTKEIVAWPKLRRRLDPDVDRIF